MLVFLNIEAEATLKWLGYKKGYDSCR